MARYQHLPVYQALYSLNLKIYRLKLKLPKSLKHDLGQLFFETSVRCLRGVVLANGSANKVPALQRVLLEFETLWVYSRLLFDLRAISSGEFQVLSESLASTGKQLQAWLKWEKQQTKALAPAPRA
ncbi:four helix bundle protein [bacterium]|nr:four helix bundle protein [bacterium]